MKPSTNLAAAAATTIAQDKRTESLQEMDAKFRQIEECPVFRPSLEEFQSKSFSDLCQEFEAQVGNSGIFKVSPLCGVSS